MTFAIPCWPPAGLAASIAHADNFTLRMGGGHTTGLTYIGVYDGFFADR